MVLAMIRRGRLVRNSKAQRRPRVSKLRAKGLSGCHPSRQQLRQPDRGPEGQNKELLSRKFTKRNRKAALIGSTGREKGSLPKKAQRLKKERRLLYAPILNLQKGKMSKLM
jgi:hypothetical protein